MEGKPLRPVTGRFRVRARAVPIPHEEGFRHAIDAALARVGPTSRGGWPTGEHKNVKVELSATIEVVNPGHIIEYCATLVPGG